MATSARCWGGSARSRRSIRRTATSGQAAERAAVNAPIQGTAADIIKLAMIRVDRALHQAEAAARMILQVHDELLFEAPPAELESLAALVRREMEERFPAGGAAPGRREGWPQLA